MKKSTIIGLSVLIVIVAAVTYRQYTFYRMPPEPEMRQDLRVGEVRMTNEVKHSVNLDDILSGGPPKDGIPSIDEPEFETVRVADQYLKDDGFGLMVEVNNSHRFYPYQILVWHEIVNETFEDESLLVTYCPLCFTGIVFERDIDGEAIEFGTSGKLWNSNLVMYDRKTDSYWSQSLGEAIVGEKTGEKLTLFPSLTMSWLDFKQNFPRGEVLSRNTGESRDYTADPYGNYYDVSNRDIYFPLTNRDSRLVPKEVIFGVEFNGAKKAYALKDIEKEGLINDTIGTLPIVIYLDPDLNAVRAFEREGNGQVRTFKLERGELVDDQEGLIWGEDSLKKVILENHFWFSWAAIHPDTELFER